MSTQSWPWTLAAPKVSKEASPCPRSTSPPEFEGAIRRGFFNLVAVVVSNGSSMQTNDAFLEFTVGGYPHRSEPFQLAAGEEKTISLVVGGHADLEDLADYSVAVEISPNPEESARIVRTGETEISTGAMPLELSAKDMVRGGTGKLRFSLVNPCEVDIDMVTAENSGADPSGEIRFVLTDYDGNILSTADYKQVLGDDVINLSGGTTIARIPPEGRFESQWTDIVVPESAGDTVYAKSRGRSVALYDRHRERGGRRGSCGGKGNDYYGGGIHLRNPGRESFVFVRRRRNRDGGQGRGFGDRHGDALRVVANDRVGKRVRTLVQHGDRGGRRLHLSIRPSCRPIRGRTVHPASIPA